MKNKSINVISWGGLGDALLITPAIKAYKEQFPDSKINLYYLPRHKEVFMNNPHFDSIKEASFKKSPLFWILASLNLVKCIVFNYSELYPAQNYNKSIIEVVADMLGVTLKDHKMHFHLHERELANGRGLIKDYKNTITINPYAVFSKNKEWENAKWEALIELMPDYTFVQVGLKKETLLKGAIDMRGKSVRESVSIVKHSDCYLGVDSFMAHAATAVGTPSVILFGPSPSIVYGHKQNINIEQKLPCAPCIDTLGRNACPYNKACLNTITIHTVKQAILKQVKKHQASERPAITGHHTLAHLIS